MLELNRSALTKGEENRGNGSGHSYRILSETVGLADCGG